MPNNFNFTESGYIPDSYDFNFDRGYSIYNILFGADNNFVAIWADLDASLTNGRFYVSSQSALSVVNNITKTLIDRYDKNTVGAANEKLKDGEVVDINIVM